MDARVPSQLRIFPGSNKQNSQPACLGRKDVHWHGFTLMHGFVPTFLLFNWPQKTQNKKKTVHTQSGVQLIPALWRLGRLLLLELSSINMMVGAALSDTGVLGVAAVGVVVGSVVAVVVVLMVVVVLVAAGVVGVAVVSMGSVASTVSRIISAPPSSDWFSVTCFTKSVLSEWSEIKEECYTRQELNKLRYFAFKQFVFIQDLNDILAWSECAKSECL